MEIASSVCTPVDVTVLAQELTIEFCTAVGCICGRPMGRSDEDSILATLGSMTGKLTEEAMPRFSATVAEVETTPSALVKELTEAENERAWANDCRSAWVRFARGIVDDGIEMGRLGTMNSEAADTVFGGMSAPISDCPLNDAGMPTKG